MKLLAKKKIIKHNMIAFFYVTLFKKVNSVGKYKKPHTKVKSTLKKRNNREKGRERTRH